MHFVPLVKKYGVYIGGTCAALLLVGVGYAGYAVGYRSGSATLTEPPRDAGLFNTRSSGDLSAALVDSGPTTDFGDFWKTWNILERNFVPSSTTTVAASTSQERVRGAIDGLVRSYNDPYTIFIPKEQAVAFKQQVNGEFEGIGAGLQVIDGMITVLGTFPDSPANKAGLVGGDQILAVDGVPTTGQNLDEIITHIRGPKGTVVSLTVLKYKSKKQVSVPVTRGTVVLPTTATRVISAAKSVVSSVVAKASESAASVAGAVGLKQKEEQAQKQQFFVLQLATFAKSSTDAFVKDLERFAKSDTPYLIIDLRNNPGGYIDTAVDLASYFLPKGTLIVSERTGAQALERTHESVGHDLLKEIDPTKRRIVVLVNKQSASASEILAGALQDHGIAKVVGETSFGKGSVQTLVDIGSLGSLKVTIARWYTPKGRNISHEGITPDIVVDLKDPKYASSTDPYIDAATETLLDDSLWK